MSDGKLQIIIGAAADRSVETVFGSIEKRAQRAGQNIAKAMGHGMNGGSGGTGGSGNPFAKMSKDADKAANDAIKAVDRQKKEVAKAAKEMQRDWEKADSERVKSAEKAARAVVAAEKSASQERKRIAAAEKRESDAEARSTSRFASHAGRYAIQSGRQMFNAAGRFGMDLARGAGVEVSVGSLVSRTVGIESAAVGLSSRGHIEGSKNADGTLSANSRVVSSGILEGEARKAGLATAVNPEEILGAGRAFVGLTGDLDLWRKIMPQVVKQTAALGGNQEDAAKAAGEFAAHVGDIPNKEQEIMHLMAVAAGQGKIGGVDFSDFAKYASRAAAPAAMYQGDKAQNIGRLTALAEISKMHGGSANAAEAFQSITQFSNTLKKTARRKTIAKLMGNENGQFTDSQNSEMRGVNDIIKDLIWGAAKDVKNPKGPRVKASQTAISTALGDVRGTRAISGLVATFNEAGGGTKGMAAVEAELKKFDGAVMSATEIDRANAAQLETTKSKTELFNQQLEAISHGIMGELGPAMKDLAPHAIGAAQSLGELTAWAIKNPWLAAGAGVAGAAGKGLAEAGVRAGFEALIPQLAGAGLALGGLTLAVAAAAAALYMIEKDIKSKEELQRKAASSDAALGVAESGGAGSNDPEFLKAKEEQVKKRLAEVARVRGVDKQFAGESPEDRRAREESDAIPFFGNTANVAARLDSNHEESLKEDLQKIHMMLSNISRGIPVTVSNANEIGQSGPKIFAPGREHNPGELPAYLRR